MDELLRAEGGEFDMRGDTEDEPIRRELYSVERLEQYAQEIAAAHKVSGKPTRRRPLLPRLEDNGHKLVAAYRALAESLRNGRAISPAAEWLVDNFHIIEEQLREIREDLPQSYYKELPKLTEGELTGYPRIYALALALIAHTDSRLDPETLRRFTREYQRVAVLSIGELWAVPITLRLVLVENLRRLATRIVASRNERDRADALADKILELAGRRSDALAHMLKQRLGKPEEMGNAFVVQLIRRLRDQDPEVSPAFEWLERQLARQGRNAERIVQQEHQRQAASQVTTGNIITSMRLISTLDWRDFFESVSLIDPLLAEDPAGTYARMDFATRDSYRHVIERISKKTKALELEVARRAVELAAARHEAEPQDRARAHVGYYLVDEGRADLEKIFNYRPRLRERVLRVALHHPTLTYLGLIALFTTLVMAMLLFYAFYAGAGPLVLIALTLLALVPSSDLALGVLNWDLTKIFKPRTLPGMDAEGEIPDDARTLVVVPTLFTSGAGVRELLEKLEVHYLANQGKNLHFALLGDFADAPAEEMPDDAALLDTAFDGIAELNARYDGGDASASRFHLFHRRRQWNASEEKWIGWERKRGKLEEFNRLLRGARDTSFVVATAAPALLAQIRYVITLDSDTQLPRGAARRLVSTAEHPLNRPHLDARTNRVMRGYAILQPRISISLTSAAKSRFARLSSGNTGVDPYTTAVSDVYQDLFGEGIYTGKGLYDVDAFEAATAARTPPNSLLSHDLFEGLFARAALVTNIELIDDYPTRYETYAKRQHRWTRGDWQIARWLLPFVPDARGHSVRNHLPLAARWKIFDNLRRSLVAPTFLLLLVAGWTFLPGSPVWWTLFVVLTLAFPIYANVPTSLIQPPRGVSWSGHLRHLWNDVLANTVRVALTIMTLAHQSSLMIDAVARTIYRKLISRKRLLEWETAAQAESRSAHSLSTLLRFMWPAELIAALAAALVVLRHPAALPLAAPFLLAWFVSPFIAYRVSRRLTDNRLSIEAKDERQARLIARRTWRYFETFVGSDDHWLPPDNYQEDPTPIIAHRTSPTNIGLLLLSTVAAHDFGYIGTLELVERLEYTFSTLDQLTRFRGHFFNWYDTRTLEPLTPQYVSTVDSGNLAGHLLAVKQAGMELADAPLFGGRVLRGLADTLTLMRDEAAHLGAVRERTENLTIKKLRTEIGACADLVMSATPETGSAWYALFDALEKRAARVQDMVNSLADEQHGDTFEELRFWSNSLLQEARACARDLQTLMPWGGALTQHLTPIISQCSPEAVALWPDLKALLDHVPSPAQVPEHCDALREQLTVLSAQLREGTPAERPQSEAALGGLRVLTSAVQDAAKSAHEALARMSRIAARCDRLVEEMDFSFLFDEERKVFTIGYSVTNGKPDNSFYDLLASESRLASFVAVAKGDAPQEHWFRLGRQLVPVDGGRALVSWTGTMFEYLMPLLVMRDYEETLLNETYKAVVTRQIEYGEQHGVPWGMSESAYNARDRLLNYQYGPFGIPGLGLKRGLSENLVISPYSTLLAAIVAPRSALENLRRLKREGALARYGFYEAIDYTPERLPQTQKCAIVRAFMAHHQGMSLITLDNLLHGRIMQQRFHAEPRVQATELLLQERIPRGFTAARPRAEEVLSGRVARPLAVPVRRKYTTADLPMPRTQLLSNGAYSVMLTTAGAGYSLRDGVAVTRWREDVTRDHWGSFCYLRDMRSGAVWSAGFQPVASAPQDYEAVFSEDKAEFRRCDAGIVTHTEIIVSPEDNAELRRVSVTNESARTREIQVTSYMEVALAPMAADAAHPAFSNLFIITEFVSAENALLAQRRRRSEHDEPIWGVHTIVVEGGETVGAVQYETDRARFLGRGHTANDPVVVFEDRPLSNTVGAVLDPIFSLRQRVRLRPGETACLTFATATARTREEAIKLADKYHDTNIFAREAALAWTTSQVELRHLNLDTEEAHLYQRLASRILYSDASLRPSSRVLAMNTKAQAGLWPHGIGGDLPIVIVRISSPEDLESVRQMLRCHEYLRLKGLVFELVILNDHPPSYLQALHDELQTMIRASGSHALLDKPGGLFLRRTDIMSDADKILLHAVARVVIVTDRGTLEEQLGRRPVEDELPTPFVPRSPVRNLEEPMSNVPALSFFNGLGGFADDGREYVTTLNEGQWTPAPWLNVIANARQFGFQVTETGAGYTWSANSRENRLTPWSNDSISDTVGEAIYLRDEETGEVWTPTPLPIREAASYQIRHGQGYTIFAHTSHGISQELLQFAPLDAPVKISLLRLQNRSDRKRRLSVTSYAEWTLGFERGKSAHHVVTSIDAATNHDIFARNAYNNEFAERVAFAAMSERVESVTCDRKEFLGRNGSPARPAALRRTELSGRAGAGLDPCAAMQAVIELAPNETRAIVMLLGEGESIEEARAVISRYRHAPAVEEAFNRVIDYWNETLDAVEVHTPDAAMDMMLNRWLLYQTLACRVWARSAFYQSGGAYGFRDQLQDVMSLVYTKPEIARKQIVRAAEHQFKEGDVQHWWHPPTGRGVRTRFSDDLLWLPYVTSFYLNVTNDTSLLDEEMTFLDAPILKDGEDESYTQPNVAAEKASLYEHCLRAIERSLSVGAHDLPLMGAGDWNDGMNRVGNEGRGESVWLGWFLHATLENFAPFCAARHDIERAARYRAHTEKLRAALEKNAWDGDWYARAFFDDGTPLGSVQNEECRIDSIAQSWGVISGAADKQRARRAMAAVEEYLVRRGDGLVLLFTPPFDTSALDPGYIKGYVPGVRENGGQYTHAAIWMVIAYASLGDGDRAGELFALLNPINHASTPAGLHKYKVEPYVAAADIYAVAPHTGRGGWTWYTGSSSWMYRAGLESILGFQVRGARLQMNPCIPRVWREFEIIYRRGATVYRIKVENPQGVCSGIMQVRLDGETLADHAIPLVDDAKPHHVNIILGHADLNSKESGKTKSQARDGENVSAGQSAVA